MQFIGPQAHSDENSAKQAVWRRFKPALSSILLLLALLLAISGQAFAGQATLVWNAATSTGVTGYKIYYGTASQTYGTSVDAGNTVSYTLGGLTEGQTYYFAAVSYDASGNQSVYSNEVSKTIPPAECTLTATAGAGGTISPAGSVTLPSGSGQAFSITPDAGYQIADVKVDGVSVGAVTLYNFTNIDANHSIAASFASIAPPVSTYTVTAQARTPYGTVSPSGTTSVNTGGSLLVTIKASPKHRIDYVMVNGVNRGAVKSVQLQNITTNYTVDAYFK